MSWNKLTPNERIKAANMDCMRHHKFAMLASIICMGKSEATESPSVPTACTNGRDKKYGVNFIAPLNRKQLRYLVLHENFHCALKHCTTYKEAAKKYPKLTNVAQDYVVNALIEEMDPEFNFVERPTQTLLIDRKYFGWSFPQVFNDLAKEDEEKGGGGSGNDFDEPIDAHEPMEFADEEDEKQHERAIEDALRQGEMLAKRLAGKEGGGRDIFGLAQQRTTDYVSAMREWITAICAGDENSRFCPPNKRMLASGFVMPSHFSESVGELIIAADTSGSMGPYYAALFGEVARICEQVKPDKVRVLWWDTAVCGDQEFTPGDYDQIASLLKPKGGGGTIPQVVVDYMAAKEYKPRGIVWLTDGYLGCSTPATPVPSLWGVVNNDSFRPDSGKVIHISA